MLRIYSPMLQRVWLLPAACMKCHGTCVPPTFLTVPLIKHSLFAHCHIARIHQVVSSSKILNCSFHSNSFDKRSFAKDSSKIEETVKSLKDSKKTQEEGFYKGSGPSSSTSPHSSHAIIEQRSLAKRIYDEALHYYHGFRLFFIDLRVSSRLASKILHGEELTRREHRQLVRTVSDVFRLLPFSVFIIVPFMELLLPVALKLFPAMLPSTFQTLSEKEMKFKKQLKVKIEMAKFLQDTLDEMAVQAKGESHSHTAKEFAQFFEKIRTSGEQVNNDEIIKFSKLFEDEITLDSLSRLQLTALCRLLELQPIGTNNFLRFQLRMKLRSLKADDQMILKEGVACLTVAELQAACRARGMRASGIPEERLRTQLKQWLELSMNERIPPSLLLLSRALYLPETLPATDQLKVTLSSLPEAAATEAKYKIGEMEGKVDNKTKLELIKKEEEEIKKEAEEMKQEKITHEKDSVLVDTFEKQKKETFFPEKAMVDSAPVLEDVDKLCVSKEDIEDIEDALEKISSEKKQLLLEKEELEDLKEEMAEYQKDIEEFKDTVLDTGHNELHESKAALRLSNKVNKMIKKMDSLIDGLAVERESLEQQISNKTKEGVSPAKERDDIISIDELVLALQRLQKVSDDAKVQRIADVLQKMDDDHDGSVEVDHVLKVIELLGQENVKLTGDQISEIVDLLIKEDALEMEEKLQKQASTESSSSSESNSEARKKDA